MATQEERLTTLEQNFATFRKETAANIVEIEENTTIMLGVMRHQGKDIRRIFEHLEIVDERLDRLETTLNEHTTVLNQHTILLNQHTALLTQILERLPKSR